MMQDRYLNPHQARTREPNTYENLLGDALERCFAAGVHDPDAIAAKLSEFEVPSPGSKKWTQDLFLQEMKRLGS